MDIGLKIEKLLQDFFEPPHYHKWFKVEKYYIMKITRLIYGHYILRPLTKEEVCERLSYNVGNSPTPNWVYHLVSKDEIHDIYYNKDRLKNDEAKHAEAWRAVNCEFHTMACA